MFPGYQILRRLKNKYPALRWLQARSVQAARSLREDEENYQVRMTQETRAYKDVEDISILPQICHYWAHTYVRPLLEEYGVSHPDQFFAKFLRVSAERCQDDAPTFLSIGAGNCDAEVRIAKLMKEAGLSRFVIDCLDMNPHTLQRGRELAEREGLGDHLAFVEGDFNKWTASRLYTGVMANQSLHHVVGLEHLFDEVKSMLNPRGYFVVSDMIGRNGHQRWPEALEALHRFWQELPSEYRYNVQLSRHEELYENWDCSISGFEGIRSQDILPLLIDRFNFRLFIPFGNVIDIFVDRGFGHNFKADQAWDKSFIDRVHAFDEESLQTGALTPTHLMAVLTTQKDEPAEYSRGLEPAKCVRWP